MNLLEYEKIRLALNDEYKKTEKLIDNGETHLDNLAEGFTESDRIIRSFVANSCGPEFRPAVRGEWIHDSENKIIVFCSKCGFERNLNDNFGRAIACPNCGANMEKEDQMGEYINRDELIKNLIKFAPEHYSTLINDLIMKQPAEKVRPVVRGKVNNVKEDNPLCYYGVCNVCGAYIPAWNYCPNCNADIRGEISERKEK